MPSVPFLYPLKTSENRRFSVFRGHKKGTLGSNGLTSTCFFIMMALSKAVLKKLSKEEVINLALNYQSKFDSTLTGIRKELGENTLK